MPHKFFELHAIKIHMHKKLFPKHIYKNVDRQIHYVNSWVHTKRTVNKYMQHIQEIPININTVINHTKDKSIQINMEIIMQHVNLSHN